MLSPQALLRGLVSRIMPAMNPDSQNVDVAQRFGRYGEGTVLSYIRKSHLLADEGSYFIANNAQTGALTNTGVAYSATAPVIIVQNQDSPGGKRLYLDYINLITTAAGTDTAAGQIAVGLAIDNILRWSSGGSQLAAAVSPNMDLPLASVAVVYFGALTAIGASAKARLLVGQRTVRPVVSATVVDVVGEQKFFNFGGVEGGSQGNIVVANANVIPVPLPPVVIGPGHSALFYIWFPNCTSVSPAPQYLPEIGWFER